MACDSVLVRLPYLRRDDTKPLSVVTPPTESEFLYLSTLTFTYLLP